MRIIKTILSLKTICELDFYAGENLYMIDPDESKFGCLASKEYNYTGKVFGHDCKYEIKIDDLVINSCVYANDITGTVVRHERNENGEVVYSPVRGLRNEILRGNVTIKILNGEDSKNE